MQAHQIDTQLHPIRPITPNYTQLERLVCRTPLIEWSGRAAAPTNVRRWEGAPKTGSTAPMSQTLNVAISVVGIDIGNNSFHVAGHDERGAIVLRQKWSRGRLGSDWVAALRRNHRPLCLGIG